MSAARVAASAAVALAALAGCTSNAEPSPAPTPTVSPSPSTSPSTSPSASPTPPTMPAAAEGTSPRAAKAFARHYFDVINYSARTGDTRELRKLGTSDCVSCNAIAHNIETIYGAGGHIESENWQLREVTVLKATNGRAVLSVGTLIHPEVVVQSNGKRSRKAGGKQPMTMFVDLSDANPRVTKLDLVT